MTDQKEKISLQDALEWFGEMFEEPTENLSASTNREAIAGWDSLGTLTLMAELDERYGIALDEDQLAGMTSLQDILNILEQHGVLAA